MKIIINKESVILSLFVESLLHADELEDYLNENEDFVIDSISSETVYIQIIQLLISYNQKQILTSNIKNNAISLIEFTRDCYVEKSPLDEANEMKRGINLILSDVNEIPLNVDDKKMHDYYISQAKSRNILIDRKNQSMDIVDFCKTIDIFISADIDFISDVFYGNYDNNEEIEISFFISSFNYILTLFPKIFNETELKIITEISSNNLTLDNFNKLIKKLNKKLKKR